ncbi:hypothetical protein N7453_007132 [Penicillium expansum]|nr:hypothetical protein N7453_007132 [Penicillium expansum]
MQSMLKSKSAVYAGDGAMDRSWRMSSTISRSRSVKESGGQRAVIPREQLTQPGTPAWDGDRSDHFFTVVVSFASVISVVSL